MDIPNVRDSRGSTVEKRQKKTYKQVVGPSKVYIKKGGRDLL
jgi:hypothetical protein